MSDTRSGSLITPRVSGLSHPGQYPSDRSVVVSAFARELGWKAPKARRVLYGVPTLSHVVAAAVRVYRRHDLPGLARFGAPMEAALRDLPAVLTDDGMIEAQGADLSEEAAEKRYDKNPCKETASAWVRAIDRERAHQLETRTALVARYEL